MEPKLQLTARGHAVCELMVDEGLSLDAACARIDHELEMLRQAVAYILTEHSWEDVPNAMQAALDGVSVRIQSVYLEESSRSTQGESSSAAQHGVAVH